MTLLTVAIVIIVVGVLLYCVNAFIPMDAQIKKILNIVVIVVLVLWLLSAFGILPSLGNIRLR